VSRYHVRPVPAELDLVPVADAVAEFQVSRSTLYKLIQRGELNRYRKVGEKRTLLDRRQVRRVLRPRLVR
jgi:predicted DNA-binding transcriptional regulator AlpA